MAFKIYFNKKTRHPSISLSGKEKEIWENMAMTHHPTKNDSYIDIVIISPNGLSKSYVRKYIRKDKRRVRGKPYPRLKLDDSSESNIKTYLKIKKKRWWQTEQAAWFFHLRTSHHLLQISNNIFTDLSNKKDNSVDRRCRLINTGELAPWNHL